MRVSEIYEIVKQNLRILIIYVVQYKIPIGIVATEYFAAIIRG